MDVLKRAALLCAVAFTVSIQQTTLNKCFEKYRTLLKCPSFYLWLYVHGLKLICAAI